MNYNEIKKICYDQFGSFSQLAFNVLSQAHLYSNLHDLSFNAGMSYKFVKEIMILFTNLNDDEYDVEKIMNLKLDKYLSQKIDFNVFIDELATILQQFKNHNKNLDHVSADTITVVKRAKFIYENNDVTNLKILFLGDHDFSSIALAFILKQSNIQPFNICVADIDENVLNFISDISLKYDLGIKVLHSDFRIGVPKLYEKQFDLIFSDPPYTPEGMALFLKRAIACSRNKYSSVYLCYKTAELVPSIGLKVQKELLKCQVYIRELIPNFNTYYGAEALGYRSDLIICNLTPKSFDEFSVSSAYNIYTHGLNSIEATSICKDIEYNEIVAFLCNKHNCSTDSIKIITNKKLTGLSSIDVAIFYKQQRNKNANYPKNSVFVHDFTYQSLDTLNLRELLMTGKDIQYAIITNAQYDALFNKKFKSIMSIFNVVEVSRKDKYIVLQFELKEEIVNSLKSIMLYKYSSIKNAYINLATKYDSVTQNQARGKFMNFKFAIYGDAYIFDLPLNILDLILKELG